jgi:tetratricopeptide (TPR) repeat protein
VALGVAVMLVLAADGGSEPIVWYPAALFLLGLLVLGVVATPGTPRPSRPAVAAAALLFAYAGWSYLSIVWADDQGVAIEGANRALLYAVAFALFALWRIGGVTGLFLVGALGFGVAGVGLVELIRLDAAADPLGFFIDRRLAGPIGYHNASAALWTLGLWPCAAVAATREVPSVLRGLALSAAGVLVGLALLGQSRGWLFSLPLVCVFFVAVSPHRARAIAALGAAALAVVLMAGPVLDVSDAFNAGELPTAVDDAVRSILLCAVGLFVVGSAAALVDRRWEPRPAVSRAIGVAVVWVAVSVLAGATVAWAIHSGDPIESLSDAWEEFKAGELPRPGEDRFTASLGSGRYDIWRVAWERFKEEPLTGIGTENFQQDYLVLGETLELPAHPHSLELRALSQTGLAGAVLLLGALVAAGIAAGWVRGRLTPLAAMASAAALSVFAYWLVHGSVDWFWELPALGVPAFGMLGLAVALAPPPAAPTPGAATALRTGAYAGATVLALLAALAIAVPWIAERRTERALDTWRTSPEAAYAELERASDLNPLASRPALVAGTIALARGELDRADAWFRTALERNPRDHYASLELGAIASNRGDRDGAVRWLSRAQRLAPRDVVTTEALQRARRGERLNLQELGARIRREARQVVAPD